MTYTLDLDFVREWFEKAADGARKQGRADSATLWRDGLAQLDTLAAERDRLKAEVAELVGAVRDVRAWIIFPFNAADEDSESLHPAFRKALKSVNAVLAKHQPQKESQS